MDPKDQARVGYAARKLTDPVALANIRQTEAERRSLTALDLLAEARQATASVQVISEPRTYSPGGKHSWFIDLFLSKRASDREARARLDRHAVEAATDAPRRAEARSQAASRAYLKAFGGTAAEQRALAAWTGAGRVLFEQRAMTRVDGDGGYLVPPAWLIDNAVSPARADAALAAAVTTLPLPEKCDSVNIPIMQTGSATGMQTTDVAPVPGRDLADSFANAPVRTIAGIQDIAAAWMEQGMGGAGGALDEIIWRDLEADAQLQLDGNLILGSGVNGQALGLFPPQTTVGTSLAVYAPSAGGTVMYAALGTPALGLTISQAVSGLTRARGRRPTHLLAAPWVWEMISSTVDSNNRPLLLPKGPHPVPSGAEIPPGVIGHLGGLPILGDLNVPDTMGGSYPQGRPYLGAVSGTQFAGQPGSGTAAVYTPVVPIVADDVYVFLGAPHIRLLSEVLSGTLQWRFLLYRYVAVMVNRYQAVTTGTLPNSGGWAKGACSSYAIVTAEVSESLLSRTGMGF